MRFTFLSLFPHLLRGYFEDSILKRAIERNLIEVEFIDFRDFATNRYKKVDNFQVSGGAGLVICSDVLNSAIEAIKMQDSHIIYLTPVAKQFNQNDAKRLAKSHRHIIFICGRYEGIDERVVEAFVDEVFSIGDYILTGGELASLVGCDSVARNIPQVLGNEESLFGESFENNLLEAPVFTKNHTKNDKKLQKNANLSVPLEYSKGNHGKIKAFKNELSLRKTKYFRPDMYQNYHK
ncbi:tRNA (guanosine(37)-N1)-methyltransferase TrmD [Helicobacter sp. 16-1353]|uniref:tRNA (guanosine(37)-N1)-methyltransferase TrmD n=1 Tax=Helicobacter sp. 16-1353 TaxID=2004996 RepID=UPI000DCD140F|nr:tRNA (guanosine(37)-N1)-methyltransferase TrmD [Helicobacter sp. 16-1353]RAX52082.1 tRNA (guanosine(37)-N1)-methyltransferase TrmD [Helicobacter sp. 16-1353]